MTLGGDPAHHIWMMLGDPTERKERPTDPMMGHQTEQPVHGSVDAAREARPLVARHDALEGADLEVVFHVNGKEVLYRRCARV